MGDDSWRLPSIVQELAATVQEPPRRYLIPVQERLTGQLAGSEMPEPVPTIDLRRLSSASDGAEEEAAKLRSALQTWGFFLVTNHGIETSLMDAVMAASREFFHRPLEEKQEYIYVPKLPNQNNDLHTNGTDLLHQYTLKCKRVKDRILREIAKLLDLDEDCLINHLGDKSSTYARFNYYPPCPRPDLVLGVSPHSDCRVLTLLLMDKDVGGLQVLREDTWYNVPPAPDQTLLINVGLVMEPVTTNSEKERISLAMFFATNLEREIQPLPELIDEKQPARYKKIKFADLVAAQHEYFSKRERVIESLKI
ncbi:hypothetical protein ACP4OV_006646 [Aristida adscensionis]